MDFVPPPLPLRDLRPPTRDPEAFYFKSGSRGGVAPFVCFECAEFRHQGTPEEFEFEIWFDKNAKRGWRPDPRRDPRARNLREPVRDKVAIVRITDERDTLAEARIALGLPGIEGAESA